MLGRSAVVPLWDAPLAFCRRFRNASQFGLQDLEALFKADRRMVCSMAACADVETTGMNPCKDRIVSLAVALLDQDLDVTASFHHRFQPTVKMPPAGWRAGPPQLRAFALAFFLGFARRRGGGLPESTPASSGRGPRSIQSCVAGSTSS